jgi:CRP-like cAMP-binding protein
MKFVIPRSQLLSYRASAGNKLTWIKKAEIYSNLLQDPAERKSWHCPFGKDYKRGVADAGIGRTAAYGKGRGMDIRKIIDQAGFFEGISRASKDALAGVCLPVERPKQTTLFREAEPGEAMFLLVRGRISLHKLSPDGRETVIKVIKPGEVFAEAILFEKKHYPVTAVSLTNILVFKLLRRDMMGLLRQEDFRNDFIAMLLRKQRYLADKIQQLTSQDVEQRLRAFLLEQYGEREEIQAEINKKQLASAIGATPETLSRLLQDLRERKCLTWKQGIIRISADFWDCD